MVWARGARIAGLLAVLVIAFATVHSSLPDVQQVVTALATAHPWFLVLAVVAELASLRHFALQQRRLLAGFGVGLSLPRAFAVTISRSAISFSLPAGSAASAAFAFRQFRIAGATRRAAGGVTVLSGVLSAVALGIMYLIVMVLPPTAAGPTRSGLFVLATVSIAMIVFVIDWRMSRRLYVPLDVADDPDPPGAGTLARATAATRRAVTHLRELPPQAWGLSLVHATINWTTDFACLAATAAAFDLDISLTRLATVYVTVQLVRQIPLTPGGMGVIEVALLAGLVSAGSGQASAAAAVLVYRLLSCWVIIPTGALAYAVLRRRSTVPVGATIGPAHAPAVTIDRASNLAGPTAIERPTPIERLTTIEPAMVDRPTPLDRLTTVDGAAPIERAGAPAAATGCPAARFCAR